MSTREEAEGLAEDIEAAAHVMQGLIVRVEALGIPLCGSYLEGSRGAARHARDMTLDWAATRRGGSAWDAMPLGREGVLLRPAVGGSISTRATRTPDGRLLARPELDLPTRPERRNLGSDLMRSDEATARVAKPIFAGLLASALSQHRWIHPGTGTGWSTTPEGAKTLTAAIAGGRSFSAWTVSQTRGTVDGEVLGMLAELGWRRLVSPRP